MDLPAKGVVDRCHRALPAGLFTIPCRAITTVDDVVSISAQLSLVELAALRAPTIRAVDLSMKK
jgi:hypothetical protein